ncbi:unnamed protein product [Ceutorhynchus assimilis]|uniref:Mitochondrial ribosomal protein S34 n=1 Tax=Ceutorhynchus assimilis TaxID=467358 RepID=A0A9N9MJH6_9CUCU|nr:unnamed protein product [Ceutorhynchus assimilis]
MPYKYIGRTHDFKGKTLWELLGNLKNFGVGRIVARNRMERYPEPSYFKILKVETLPQPENESIDNLRKIRLLVEKTFRGKTYPEPRPLESASYKTDYKLIPKDEEADYCKAYKPQNTERILPRTMEFPPLLKELVARELKNTPSTKDDLELKIFYNRQSVKMKYRIAEEGEEPTEKFTMGLGKPVAPRLYKGINL